MVFQDLWIYRPTCMLLSRKNGSLQNDHVLYVLFKNSPNWTKPCFNKPTPSRSLKPGLDLRNFILGGFPDIPKSHNKFPETVLGRLQKKTSRVQSPCFMEIPWNVWMSWTKINPIIPVTSAVHPRKITWQWKNQPFEDASLIKNCDFPLPCY